MMGVIDRFIEQIKLNDNEADGGYFDEEDEVYYDDVVPARKPALVRDETPEKEEPFRKSSPKVTSIKSSGRRTMGTTGMEVCVIKPTTFEEAREITDTLLLNRTVVLNLEGLDVDIAQRILDFTSGSCYAIHGNLQKISHYIFIITPSIVDISGDFPEKVAGSFDVSPGI